MCRNIKKLGMKRKVKIASLIIAVVISLALIIEAVIYLLFPGYTFSGYLVIPFFFAIIYVCASFFITPNMTSRQLTKKIIGLKAVKMFVCLSFLVIAAVVMRDNVIAIAINFLVYYIILLIPECAYCMYMKKHIKE